MIDTWADLFFALLPMGTAVGGFVIGRAYTLYEVRDREVLAELRGLVANVITLEARRTEV